MRAPGGLKAVEAVGNTGIIGIINGFAGHAETRQDAQGVHRSL